MRIDNLVSLVATVGIVTVSFSGILYANDVEKSGAKVTSLMQKALPDYPGKEAAVARIEFPPDMSMVHIAMTRMCSCTCWKDG